MKNCVLKIILFCNFLFLLSCKNEAPKPKTKNKIAGVVLSFDDDYVNEWHATNQKLKKYSWKGTFFVCRINKLDQYEIGKLLEMQNEGHEIAAHGLNHLNAADYTRVHTINDYMNREINPMLDLINFYGFKVSSFAYPYGGRSQKLDTALLNKFKIIRGRAFCEEDPSKISCFYNNSRLVFSFSIDDTHNHFDMPYLLKLLDYAKKNDKILILNSHRTVDKVIGDYQTKNSTLEYVCKYIKRNNMKFYTLLDLEKLNGKPF